MAGAADGYDVAVVEAVEQVLEQEPVSPRYLNPSVPIDLETVCLKCLEKTSAKRYASAEALAEDLGRFLEGRPIQARPVGITERSWRWCWRNPALATASGVAAMGIILAFVTFAAAFFFVSESRDHALKLADDKDKLAKEEYDARTKATKATLEAGERLEQAEAAALRVQFEHYFAKSEEQPDIAMVGMASLLPNAARRKDPSMAESIRLHLGALNGRVARINAICDHQNWVSAVALSADGKTALTSSQDNTAQLWEAASGKPIGSRLQHKGEVRAVALSADGKTALTGSLDGTGRLWETASGAPICPPLRHEGAVYAVALSADGKTALTGSGDGTARLWETASGDPIGPPRRLMTRTYS